MKSNRFISYWLASICFLITAMVTIGGITRLTGSGLSITEWTPIMGVIPPLNEVDWDHAFSLYRATPQGQLVNAGMSLHDFKWIFFWEYAHRLLGRLIGVFVFLPGVIFFIQKRLSSRLLIRISLGFLLGGFQGLLGWFMVMSGLINIPAVSHFRLAAHLFLALCLLGYFTDLTLRHIYGEMDTPLAPNPKGVAASDMRSKAPRSFWLFSTLLALQIIYGAFVAGMKAGYGFNTFPLMDGHFFPGNGWALEPLPLNFLENPSLVQWTHRSLGWGLFFSACVLLRSAALKSSNTHFFKRPGVQFGLTLLLQFSLGIATLVSIVAIPLAVIHQGVAACLVILAVRFHFYLTRPHLV